MTTSKFSEENRDELIRSLEFFQCLSTVIKYVEINHASKNPLILDLLQILGRYRDSHWNQVKDYGQLLTDSVFWQSRKFYLEKLQNFVAGKLDGPDFVAEILYKILSDKNEALSLEEDFSQQRTVDLDPKSFQFSKIILNLLLPIEGFDENPEESFFTEDELREGVKLALKELEKYFKD